MPVSQLPLWKSSHPLSNAARRNSSPTESTTFITTSQEQHYVNDRCQRNFHTRAAISKSLHIDRHGYLRKEKCFHDHFSDNGGHSAGDMCLRLQSGCIANPKQRSELHAHSLESTRDHPRSDCLRAVAGVALAMGQLVTLDSHVGPSLLQYLKFHILGTSYCMASNDLNFIAATSTLYVIHASAGDNDRCNTTKTGCYATVADNTTSVLQSMCLNTCAA